MDNKRFSLPVFLICGLVLLFGASIVWINFHSGLWYDHDIYPDAYLSRLMAEEHTLFPSDWIFGNRYFIIGTPVLAALFHHIVPDSMISLAIASSLMTVLVLLSFVWAFAPGSKKAGLAAGILCIIGGVILGVRASTFIAGLQILYTMSSYYACYLIVILLSLGVYLRIRNRTKVPWVMYGLCLALNFAVGIHSVREMLLLNIPLVCVEGLALIRGLRDRKAVRQILREEEKALLFVGLTFALNLLGILVSNHIPAKTAPIIDTGLVTSLPELWTRFLDSCYNIFEITGLYFPLRGAKCYPLFAAAVLILSSVIYSCFRVFKSRDDGWLATAVKFSLVSVFGVWLAGILVIHARPLYYFVYYLLASLCIVYLISNARSERWKNWGLIGVLAVSSISYVSNFLPDFMDYRANGAKARRIARELADRGDIDCIYDLYNQHPVFAAFSKDRIISSTVFFDYGMEDGKLFKVNCNLITTRMQEDAYFGRELISMTREQYEGMRAKASEAYLALFDSSMSLELDERIGANEYLLFRPTVPVLGRPIDP